ncbi:DEAD/DEAH box helicase [Streptococcus pseudopneumoniae]|uniref:DEAD/DEAH box helicase n=1 Tax=Streptococcus pseudopneumoniae TaxID=257758 RepID=UPI0018B0A740|nr:DEAD/DEAH box helicase [Streptococcus pseudopneumoniae]MBF9684557.1 DEAD/DEAH box helicase [Streptococcus pseudopneumoniae]
MIEFGKRSLYYSKLIRSKAKMIEFDIPLENHISISEDSHKSFLVALAIVEDSARKYFEDYINHNHFDPHLKNQLHHAAEFFDALILSELGNADEYRDYIAMLGATAYYLGDYNGSSSVMLSYISDATRFPEDSSNLIKVLIDILTNRVFENYELITDIYSAELNTLVERYRNYILEGRDIATEVFRNLQDKVYINGSDFSVIIVNCLLAVVCKKINCSSTKLLPEFSELDFSVWQDYIQSEGSMKELWPSQIELGKQGIFIGRSGIIQMPTSSGKTASINLILRSAFYSNRIDNVLIVAPFRALCREIYRDINAHFINNEDVIISEIFDLPEIPQDFSIFNDSIKRVFVLTPEKLLFLLRNNQSFIDRIGLCIFDEAHLFDDPNRGSNFELLMSTVKQTLQKEVQKILISAVIPNSEAINKWFNEDGVVVSNNSIKTTEKRIAFSDLNGSNEQLYFIDPITFEEEFFVPRTVNVSKLELLGKERKPKVFPELKNANDISIYYGIKLIKNGGVAIFCGRKDTVNIVLRRFIDLNNRKYDLSDFLENSDRFEVEKIGNLIGKNIGYDSVEYTCSQLGIFSHHSGIPMGLRIAIEYAFSKSKINNVVCTSTLAQGVNLPIKYLIVSSMYQAGDAIKVRDFQNLIGRAGRAGKYTEGTIILTESGIYKTEQKSWKKKQYKKLLNPINSEGCKSNILNIIKFDSVDSTDYRYGSMKFDFWNLILERFINNVEYLERVNSVSSNLRAQASPYLQDFNYKINQIESTLIAIENYLASIFTDEMEIDGLAENTFGYFLGDENERERIKELFDLVRDKIITSSVSTEILSKNSIGLYQSEHLKAWVQGNQGSILSCEIEKDLLSVLIEIIREFSNNKVMRKLSTEDLNYITQLWINGISYFNILESCTEKLIRIEKRGKLKSIDLSDIISLCDNGLGYETSMILNSINNILEELVGEKIDVITKLTRRLKYGLSLDKEINIYELGFSDRIVVQLIGQEIKSQSKNQIRNEIKRDSARLKDKLSDFPSYYIQLINEI